jgi:hypothetical protein
MQDTTRTKNRFDILLTPPGVPKKQNPEPQAKKENELPSLLHSPEFTIIPYQELHRDLSFLILRVLQHPDGGNQTMIPDRNMLGKLLLLGAGVKRMLRKLCA